MLPVSSLGVTVAAVGGVPEQRHGGDPPTELRVLQGVVRGRFQRYGPNRLRRLEQQLVQGRVFGP